MKADVFSVPSIGRVVVHTAQVGGPGTNMLLSQAALEPLCAPP